MKNQISSTRTVWTSFLVDLGDIILNVIVMLVTGSVVMLAEAFEGLSDLVASAMLLIGLKMSKKRPNKKTSFRLWQGTFLLDPDLCHDHADLRCRAFDLFWSSALY